MSTRTTCTVCGSRVVNGQGARDRTGQLVHRDVRVCVRRTLARQAEQDAREG